MKRKIIYPVRLADEEMYVLKELSTAYTEGNVGAMIRTLIWSAGSSARLLTDKDICLLEKPRSTRIDQRVV